MSKLLFLLILLISVISTKHPIAHLQQSTEVQILLDYINPFYELSSYGYVGQSSWQWVIFGKPSYIDKLYRYRVNGKQAWQKIEVILNNDGKTVKIKLTQQQYFADGSGAEYVSYLAINSKVSPSSYSQAFWGGILFLKDSSYTQSFTIQEVLNENIFTDSGSFVYNLLQASQPNFSYLSGDIGSYTSDWAYSYFISESFFADKTKQKLLIKKK